MPEALKRLLQTLKSVAFYLGFMLAFAALTVESFNLKSDMTLAEAKKVAFADGAYGVAATMILITGVLSV
ncbi:DUF2214 family protein [Coleofasciculus sp. C1-SOL-03]|uniref:DUF2214 family protein n=1 Tax=Coleofasciculus sp. C1-SOL-03 TaxID=3069522 RepID=UPI0040635F56